MNWWWFLSLSFCFTVICALTSWAFAESNRERNMEDIQRLTHNQTGFCYLKFQKTLEYDVRTAIDTTWCTKNFMETIQISKGLKATSEPLSFWLTNRGWCYIMDIITYTEHLVDHESAMCTRSIVADLPDSVTNLDSLLALKCLFIIIGQRLFSSSSQFCLISTTQSRNVLYLEEVQKQSISQSTRTLIQLKKWVRLQ